MPASPANNPNLEPHSLVDAVVAGAQSAAVRTNLSRAGRLDGQIKDVDSEINKLQNPGGSPKEIAEAEQALDFFSELGRVATEAIITNERYTPNLPPMPRTKEAFAAQADYWAVADAHRELGTIDFHKKNKSGSAYVIPIQMLPPTEQAKRAQKVALGPLEFAVRPETEAQRAAALRLVREVENIREKREIQGNRRRMHGESGNRHDALSSRKLRKKLDKEDDEAYADGTIDPSRLHELKGDRLTYNGRTAIDGHSESILDTLHGNVHEGLKQHEELTEKAEELDELGHMVIGRITGQIDEAQKRLDALRGNGPSIAVKERELEAARDKLVDKLDKRLAKAQAAKTERDARMAKIEDRWEARLDAGETRAVIEKATARGNLWDALAQEAANRGQADLVGMEWRGFRSSEKITGVTPDGTRFAVQSYDKKGKAKGAERYMSADELEARLSKIPGDRIR